MRAKLEQYSITTRHLEAAIIDQVIAGQFHDKIYVFVAVPTKPGWGLGVAVANEQGFWPITGKDFEEYRDAKRWARELNAHIGRTPDEVMNIISSTMRGPPVVTR